MVGPSPSRLGHLATDPEPTDLDDLFSQQRQFGDLARVREVLPDELHRRRMAALGIRRQTDE
jgi:hypothetical protein